MSDAFHDMEQLNIVFDIWIDAEEYDELPKYIKLKEELKTSIDEFFDDNCKLENFSSLLKLGNEDSRNGIQHCGITEFKSYPNKETLVSNKDWGPLFLAKYLRAKILEKGTDDYTKHLDHLVTYLQQKIPYLLPKTPKQSILQSLYFQELSACGSPGLESLGFALRAFKLLQKDKQTGSEDLSPFSMELYKLWAKYNQGIGYSHSGQQDKASEAFDEIIQKIPQIDDFGKNEIDKNLWENLLLNPAILSKAELLEDLQLSYHTLKTLKRLDNRNNKNRLIKEALAYRDMGRMREARQRIEALLGASTIEDFFENAKNKEKKRNIKSKTLGLLFDYYLLGNL